MNQVPWRRILERVDDESQDDAVSGMRDPAVEPRHESHGADHPRRENRDFEAELFGALNQSYDDGPPRRQRQPAPHARPQQRTVVKAEGPTARMPVPQRRDGRTQVPAKKRAQTAHAPHQGKRTKGSGVKDMLAISLSIVVVGVAVYQINNEWRKVNGVESSSDRADAAKPVAAAVSSDAIGEEAGADAAASATPPAETNADRVDLQPSFASEDRTVKPEANAPDESEGAPAVAQDAEEEEETVVATQGGHISASAPERRDGEPIGQGSTERAMLRRGHDLIKQGHVSGARLIFEHLAEQDSALGAFALAQSYDPKYLASNDVENVEPDEKLAARWYQKAAKLTEAAADR